MVVEAGWGYRGGVACEGLNDVDCASIDRRIAYLAVPALGALIAEPLFLAVDAALIGHLGVSELAGLAVASAILQTAVGLMIFLAYSTTPIVARRRGAGDVRGAVQAGIDGLWLALGIGVVVGVLLGVMGRPLVGVFHVERGTAELAVSYLGVSCLGIPAMLVVFAASGLLRGVQDTRTPLVVAAGGFAVNGVLNWWCIYGLGLGMAGSAWGTVASQWAMVVVYLVVISRHARRVGARVLPQGGGLAKVGVSGWWLFIRTVGLRVAMLVTVGAATSYGTSATAGYQVVFTMFSMAAFALDALAIAAQALIGDALGAGCAGRARFIMRRTLLWGVVCGTVAGVCVAVVSPGLGVVFTSDGRVLELLPPAFMVLAVSLPVCGVVFVLDGVLMGAGDARYLAWTSLVNLVSYLPVLWVLTVLAPRGVVALVALTAGFAIVFMVFRMFTLGVRVRGERWVRLGVDAVGAGGKGGVNGGG